MLIIQDVVGRFFERLAACILRGHPPLNGTLDLGIGSLAIGGEVKARGPDHRFIVAEEQFEEHRKQNLGLFPDLFEELLYLLFCYKNPRVGSNGSRKTLLSTCATEQDIVSILAKNADRLYVMDHRIIAAIRDLHGTRHSQILCHREDEAICIGRTYLRGFTGEMGADQLTELGLDSSAFAIRERKAHVSIWIGEVATKVVVDIVEVVPHDTLALMDKALKTPQQRPCRRVLRISV